MVTIIATISAYDLHRFKTKSENTAVLICVTALIIHAFFAGLKVVLLLNGSEIISLTSQVLINTSTYMEVLIVSLFWTYGIIMMINQRLTAEMKRSKDQFEIIFNTSPDAIIITTLKEGIITSFNDKFSELAGYKLAELVGKTSIELNLWKNQAERAEFVAMVHKKGYHFDYEIDYRVKDNSISTGLISSRVIQLNDKEQMISIIRDISDRKQREKEIIVQNIELQTINREKDKFFSIIAHDLKSPFSSFLGLTEIMAEEIPNLPLSEVIQLAAKMRDSARNLYGLLVNLLEWSLITQGLTKFNPVQMPLLQEIKESMLTYRVPALKKNIQILIEVADECQVYADQNMLRSLVRNLLSNAIKFTREGGSVFVTAVNQADQGCVIAVKDTGIGISAEMQQLLFKGTSKNYFFDAVV
jgi:PAS domain S-box-containing protein